MGFVRKLLLTYANSENSVYQLNDRLSLESHNLKIYRRLFVPNWSIMPQQCLRNKYVNRRVSVMAWEIYSVHLETKFTCRSSISCSQDIVYCTRSLLLACLICKKRKVVEVSHSQDCLWYRNYLLRYLRNENETRTILFTVRTTNL